MLNKIHKWYQTKKDYFPTICFLCGSTWDTLTLRRVDSVIDLSIFSSYLVFSAIIVVLISRNVTFKFSKYLPAAAQFFFGGLLSATTVYYFKSTSSLSTFLFILCLASLLVANEFIEKKYNNAQVSFTLWSICIAMILNILMPVLLHKMESWVFITSMLVATILCFFIRKLGHSGVSIKPVITIYSILLFLYFLNIIPPVPLSTKQLAVFHSVHRNNNNYICYMEKPAWFEFFKKGEKNYSYKPGDTLFCFSSVFAPTQLKKKIYHHWYYKSQDSGKFQQVAKIGYNLTGGRNDGYRGYTYVKNVKPGKWKVKLKTNDGKTIGIESFKVSLSNKLNAPAMQIHTY